MAHVIRELSKSMINKIAAGEVVERPANVVKELVENSIDAGADRVEIEIVRGGVEEIRIIDNGCGIPSDQLVLALSPHATSKLSEPDDLFRIHTLGFRGEALASIAEISRLTLTSRVEGAKEGSRIRCDGGNRSEILPLGRAVGTTIEVRDIFFNVPARRKFLKSVQSEFGHIQEAVVRLAIPNSNISFVLKHNGRLIYDLPANEGYKERLRRLFKDDVASRLIHVEMQYQDIRVEGYIGSPDLSRGTTALQYIFLNKRYIRDRALQHAVAEAYRGLQLSQRYPVAFLNVTVPPSFVDFNVHPTKMEVRFVDAQGIYAGLLGAIRSKFLSSDLTSRPSNDELTAALDRSAASAQTRAEPQPLKLDSARLGDKLGSDREQKAADGSGNAEQKTTGNPTAKEPEREHEYRFVPDVDPGDPIKALDESVVDKSRQSIRDYFNSMKISRQDRGAGKPTSDEQTQAASEEQAIANQARLDVEEANKALMEAAALDSERENAAKRPPRPSEQPVRELQKRNDVPTRNPFAQERAFQKFPPLQNERQTRPGEAPEPVQKPSQKPGQPVSEPPSQPSSEAPEPVKEQRRPAPKEPSLFDRVVANNEETLVANKPLSTQVARNSRGRPVVQLCSRYLVMEAEDGIAIVDQHALHERILFERFKASLDAGSLDVQRLLVPDSVDLSPTETPIFLENKEIFNKLGLIVEECGGGSRVMICSYPSILGALRPDEIFQAILGAILERKGKVDRSDLLDAALKQAACKAAIKAGDLLAPEAVARLIAEAEEEIYAHHCPHGRPSTLVLSRAEIDKLFKRQ